MTAIVAGQGMGLFNTSAGLLGGQGVMGTATQGRSGQQVSVNASNGNLIVQQQDEWLVGIGPDVALGRTYNSQGSATDDNGDNWRLGVSRKIYGLSGGTVNNTNTSVKRVNEDGSETIYNYDATRKAYISKDGGGAYDTLTYAGGTWTWVDGTSRTRETYTAISGTDARLSTIEDPDGNKLTLSYSTSTSYIVKQIDTTTSTGGEKVELVYDEAGGKPNNLKSVTTTYKDTASLAQTVKRVSYTYDPQDRLKTVTVDLTPTDNGSTADGATYVTTYTYKDTTTKRLASITETDGSNVTFDYDPLNTTRIKTIQRTVGGKTLTTTINYGTGETTVIDPMGQATVYTYETAAGQNQYQLKKITAPVIFGPLRAITFAYDQHGNVSSVTDARGGTIYDAGNTVVYRYDSQGNRVYERDPVGNVIERTYSGSNLLLQETVYTGRDTDGDGVLLPSGAQTTRYVYDNEGHLRFSISPQGRVTENVYNALGQMTSSIIYTDATFDAATLTTWAQNFTSNANGLTLDTGFTVAGGTLNVKSTSQTTQGWPNAYGASQPMGSSWYAEFTTPAAITDGLLDIGIDSGSWGNSNYRRHRLLISNGSFTADVYAPDALQKTLGTVLTNKPYVLEIVTSADGGSTLYVYEKGKERSSGFSDTRNLGGWGSPSLAIQTYNGPTAAGGTPGASTTITLDNLKVEQPVESVLSNWTALRKKNLAQRTNYTYNSRGQLDKSTIFNSLDTNGAGIGLGTTTQYAYDQAGNLLKVIDGRSGETSYSYDGLNRVKQTKDALGNKVVTTYTDGSRLEVAVADNGLTTTNTYDEAGRLVSAQRSDSVTNFGTTTYTYDGNDHLRAVTSPTGEKTFYLYDQMGRKAGEIDPAGALTEYIYNGNGAVIQTTRRANAISAPMLAALTADPMAGGLTEGASDPIMWGRTIEGSATNFTIGTHYWYEASDPSMLDGEQMTWIRQSGTEPISSYVSTGQFVTAASNYEVSAYTGAQRATVSLEVQFYSSLTTFNDSTKVGAAVTLGANASEAAGGAALTGYKRLSGFVVAPAGAVYMRVMVRKAPTNAAQADSYMYVAKPIVRYAASTQSKVSPFNVRPAASAQDRHTFNIYNNAGQLTQTVDGVGAVVDYQYDGAGRLVTTRAYNTKLSSGTLAAIRVNPSDQTPFTIATHPNDRVERSYYGADGLLEGKLASDNSYTEYTYDGAGRLTKVRAYATLIAGSVADGAPKPTPTASGNDLITQYLYNSKGQQVGMLDAEGHYTLYTYDGSGNQNLIRRYANKVQGTFDGVTPPQAISASATPPSTGSYVITNSEDKRVSRVYYANNWLESEIEYPQVIGTYYTYDALGNVTNVEKGWSTTRTALKRYDGLGRVTSALGGEGYSKLAQWVSDNPGASASQLKNKTDEIYNTWGTRYVYDQGGRLVASIAPDGSGTTGNKTLYYYDADGRLTYQINALGEVSLNTYDIFGGRTSATAVVKRMSASTLAGLSGGRDTAVAAAVATLLDTAKDSKVQWSYDLRGQQGTITDALNNVTTQTYNAFGQLSASKLNLGSGKAVTHQYFYDLAGRLNSDYETETPDYTTRAVQLLSYDAFGRVTSVEDGLYQATRYTYDKLGRQVTVTDRAGAGSSATYDAFDRKLSVTDALGAVTSYSYNTIAAKYTVTTPENIAITTAINEFGETVSVTDGRGSVTAYTYNNDGQLTGTSVTASGAGSALVSSSVSYDSAGRVFETKDGRGTVTRTTYDAANRVLTRLLDPGAGGLNLKTEYRYDGKGQAVWSRDAKGVWTKTEFDLRGQVLATVVDPLSIPNPVGSAFDDLVSNSGGKAVRTEYSYDVRGNVLTVKQGAGTTQQQTTQYTYDGFGRRVSQISDPGGQDITTTFTYDDNDNVVAATDANGNVTRYVYDTNDRLTYSVDATGAVTYTEYDQVGHVVRQTAYANRIELGATTVGGSPSPALGMALGALQITERLNKNSQLDHVVRNVYDKDGRRTHSVDPLGYVVKYVYDKNGNVVQSTRYATAYSGGLTETKTNGAMLSLTAPTVASHADDQLTQFSYDAANRLIWSVDARGYASQNIYDGNGNVTQIKRYAKALQYVNSGQTELTVNQVPQEGSTTTAGAAYVVLDPTNDQVSYSTYDTANRLTWAVDAQGYVTKQTYYDNGQVKTTTRYANAVSGFTGGTPAPLVDSANDASTTNVYDNAGRLSTVTNAENVVTQYTYDGAGNVLTSTQAHGTDDASQTAYEYDLAGRVTSVTQAAGTAAASKTVYTLNDLGQRTAILDPVGQALLTSDAQWAKDLREAYGLPITVAQLTAPHKAAIKATYTTTQTFDAAGRLKEVINPEGTKVTLTYDAFGNVITTKTANQDDTQSKTTQTFYDAANHTIWSIDALDGAQGTEYDAFGRIVKVTAYANTVTGSVSATDRRAPKAFASDMAAIDAGVFYYVVSDTATDRVTTMQYDKRGQVLSTTDAENANEYFSYDAFGNQLTHTNKLGGITTKTFDRLGRILTLKAPEQVKQLDNSGAIVLNSGNPVMVDVIATYTYDARGNVKRLIQGTGLTSQQRTTDFKYDKLNRLVEQTGEAMSTYNASTGTTQASETPKETFKYDLRGNQIEAVTADGGRTLTYWDALGRKSAQITATGSVTHWNYDTNGHMVVEQNFGVQVTLPTNAGGARPTPVDTSNSREKTYLYDNLGRLVESRIRAVTVGEVNAETGNFEQRLGQKTIDNVVYANNDLVTTYGYDTFGNLARETDPRGTSTYHYYDLMGRRVATVDGERYVHAAQYDAFGLLSGEAIYAAKVPGTVQIDEKTSVMTLFFAVGMGASRIMAYGYNRMGQVTSKTIVGVEASTVDSGTGQLNTTTTDAVTTYVHNKQGQVIEQHEATGEVIKFAYDKQGRQKQKQGAEFVDYQSATVRQTTDIEYNALGDVLRTIERGTSDSVETDDRITTYVYGKNGYLSSKTDATGAKVSYFYDVAGHKTSERLERNDQDGLLAANDAAAKGKLWVDAQAGGGNGGWVDMVSQTSVPSANGVTLTTQVILGTEPRNRDFYVGLSNNGDDAKYKTQAATGVSARSLNAEFKGTQLHWYYIGANGNPVTTQAAGVTLVAGRTYSVTVKLLADRSRIEVYDTTTPGTVWSNEVLYGTGKSAAQEWGASVKAHIASGGAGGGARDAIDNVKLVNASSTPVLNEDFSTIGSGSFGYVNNESKTFWQEDSSGRNGRISTDTTDYVYDLEGRVTQTKRYATQVGNVDQAGNAIRYTQTSSEQLLNAFGEVVYNGTNGGAWEVYAKYDNAGRMTTTNEGGVEKVYAYDGAGNRTLEAVTTGNLQNNTQAPSQTNAEKSFSKLFVYDKRNQLTDTYSVRTDSPIFTQAGVYVPDGGAIAQGASFAGVGTIATTRANPRDTSGGYKADTVNITVPNLPIYEGGDIVIKTEIFRSGSAVANVTRTYAQTAGSGSYATGLEYHYSSGSPTKYIAPTWLTWTLNASDTARVTVMVVTKSGTYNVLGGVNYLSYAPATDPATVTTTVPKSLNIKDQPVLTSKVVLMYREAATNGKWSMKTLAQVQNMASTKTPGWFTLSDFTGMTADGRTYDFRYVALDPSDNVLNSQGGTFQLTASGLSVTQVSRSVLGQGGRAFLDAAGALNVLEQPTGTVTAKIMVRQRGTTSSWSTWQNMSTVTVPGGASATKGWFKYTPSGSGTYDYIVQSEDGLGKALAVVRGSYTVGDASATSVPDPVNYNDIPQVIKLDNQPLAAVRGEVLYKLKDSTGTPTTVAMTKVSPGVWGWDALTLSLSNTGDTIYDVQYRLFDAAGRLVSWYDGTTTLGANSAVKVTNKLTDPHLFLIKPQFSALYNSSGAYIKVYTRIAGQSDYQPVPFTPNWVGELNLDMYGYSVAQQIPDNGYLDLEYYYEVYTAGGTKLTTPDGTNASTFVMPTAGAPAKERFWAEARPNPDITVIGYADEAKANHESLQYNAYGEVVQATDALKNTTKFEFNAQGKMIKKTDPTVSVMATNGVATNTAPETRFYYDLQGRLVGARNANNFLTSYVLRAAGNGETVKLKEFHPDGGNKVDAYDVFGDMRDQTDERGNHTTYEYDGNHRVVRVNHQVRTDGAYNTKRGYDAWTYDAAGNRISHTTSPDTLLTYEDRTYYDAMGRTTRTVSAEKRQTAIRYEDGITITEQMTQGLSGVDTPIQLQGTRVSLTDANGRTMVDEYDAYGYKTKHTDLGGTVFTYTYDTGGWLRKQTNTKGQHIVFEYYDDGRVKAINDKTYNTYTVYAYDQMGRRTFEGYATVDGSNFFERAVISYDALGRMKSVTDPQVTFTYDYDAVGNRVHIGSTTTGAAQPSDMWYTYDSMGRTIIGSGKLSGAAGAQGTTVIVGTSGTTGTKTTYDKAGNRTQVDFADGHSEQYTYTTDGHLANTTSKAATAQSYSAVSTRTVDLLGRVVTMADASTGTGNHTYAYDKDGKVSTETTTGAQTVTVTYNYLADGTTDNITTTTSGQQSTTLITQFTYEWWDTAKASALYAKTSTAQSNTNFQAGTSQYVYDKNGNVMEARDVVANRVVRYVNNAEGKTLFRSELTPGAEQSTRQAYFYVDSQRVGETGNDNATAAGHATIDYARVIALGAGQTQYAGMRPIGSSGLDDLSAMGDGSMAYASSGYTVRSSSETLDTIARTVYGDSSMWYVIAQANGMSGNTQLKLNQVLKIPALPNSAQGAARAAALGNATMGTWGGLNDFFGGFAFALDAALSGAAPALNGAVASGALSAYDRENAQGIVESIIDGMFRMYMWSYNFMNSVMSSINDSLRQLNSFLPTWSASTFSSTGYGYTSYTPYISPSLYLPSVSPTIGTNLGGFDLSPDLSKPSIGFVSMSDLAFGTGTQTLSDLMNSYHVSGVFDYVNLVGSLQSGVVSVDAIKNSLLSGTYKLADFKPIVDYATDNFAEVIKPFEGVMKEAFTKYGIDIDEVMKGQALDKVVTSMGGAGATVNDVVSKLGGVGISVTDFVDALGGSTATVGDLVGALGDVGGAAGKMIGLLDKSMSVTDFVNSMVGEEATVGDVVGALGVGDMSVTEVMDLFKGAATGVGTSTPPVTTPVVTPDPTPDIIPDLTLDPGLTLPDPTPVVTTPITPPVIDIPDVVSPEIDIPVVTQPVVTPPTPVIDTPVYTPPTVDSFPTPGIGDPYGLYTLGLPNWNSGFLPTETSIYEDPYVQPISGQYITVKPGDTASSIMGSSGKQAVGAFLAGNDMTSSNLKVGQQVFRPDDIYAFGDQSGLGQSVLSGDNARVEAYRKAQVDAEAARRNAIVISTDGSVLGGSVLGSSSISSPLPMVGTGLDYVGPAVGAAPSGPGKYVGGAAELIYAGVHNGAVRIAGGLASLPYAAFDGVDAAVAVQDGFQSTWGYTPGSDGAKAIGGYLAPIGAFVQNNVLSPVRSVSENYLGDGVTSFLGAGLQAGAEIYGTVTGLRTVGSIATNASWDLLSSPLYGSRSAQLGGVSPWSPRNLPGMASMGGDLTSASGRWLDASSPTSIPLQIAQQLEGKKFSTFDDLRSAVWKAVGNDAELSSVFSPGNVGQMQLGNAPFAPKAFQNSAFGNRYNLHHVDPIANGGGVYDLSNLRIVSPQVHYDIHY